MTFRDFMDASYALMAEEHQRVNPLTTLIDVAEKLEPRRNVTADGPKPSPRKREQTAAENEASLNILTAAMSGVRGPGPAVGKKQRRPRV